MRKVWLVLGVGVLCLPLIFVVWLLAATRWPKMDATTVRLPQRIRAVVADAVEQNAMWGKGRKPVLERVIRLDPDNPDAWAGLCTNFFGEEHRSSDVQTCQRAVSLRGDAANYNGLGDAQERANDNCAAEESFTKAAGQAASSGMYLYAESMGRAALKCGRLYYSRAGLETALELADKQLHDSDNEDDEVADIKNDIVTDNEYLVITLDRLHEAKASKAACTAAHPKWQACNCALDDDSNPVCHEAKP